MGELIGSEFGKEFIYEVVNMLLVILQFHKFYKFVTYKSCRLYDFDGACRLKHGVLEAFCSLESEINNLHEAISRSSRNI